MEGSGRGQLKECLGRRGIGTDRKSLLSWSGSGACFRLFCALRGRLVREGVGHNFRRNNGKKD